MSTLKVADGVRRFTTGKSHLGDSFVYSFVLSEKECESEEEVKKFLNEVVPHNTSIPDFLKDVKEHCCSRKNITRDDDKVRIEIGFTCACGVRWVIPLADVKACAVHFPEYKESVRTSDSRDDWIKSFN